MEPSRIDDPRDGWARARRREVFRYAQELGFKDIVEQMPKDLMVRLLKSRGAAQPKVPLRPLGQERPTDSHHINSAQAETTEIDADELLAQEWAAQQKPDIANMSFNDMRAELKAAGVKLDRKWRMDDVRAQLEKLRHG